MTSSATQARSAGRWLSGITVAGEDSWTAPDARRKLQLLVAGVWLLDAILQFQAFMFSKGFAQMLGATGPGNPGVIAGPISWAARIIAQHGIVTNAIFAAIQLLIALGIAFRPTVRLALGVSIAWALAVWWLGEGLGGVLSGAASPVNGAPGAVILYALLAVLLWPPRRERPASFVAAGATRAGGGQGPVVRPVGQPGLPVPDAGHPGAARHLRHDLRYGLGRAALARPRRPAPGRVPGHPRRRRGRHPGRRAGRGGSRHLPAAAGAAGGAGARHRDRRCPVGGARAWAGC